MRIYLAAKFSRRKEMEKIADRLSDIGYDVISSWVYGAEEGLSIQEIALLDLKDLDNADTIILFSHHRATEHQGGGRYVEFGYAYAKGKRCIIIGEFENCFHALPEVEIYTSLEEFLKREFLDEN